MSLQMFRSIPLFIKSIALLALVMVVAIGLIAGPNLAGAQEDTAFATGEALVVNTDALNLRAAASADAEIIATLDTGAAVTITGAATVADGYDWYPVDTDAGSGYVAGEFLGATVTVSTDLGIAIGDTLVVNTDVLNLRSGATTGGDVLAELATGDAVSVLDGPVGADGYTWYRVSSDAGTGWVAGDFLAATVTVASDLGITAGTAVFVDTDVLNLRSDATVDGEILATLETSAAGTVVSGPVSADGYTWYQITTDAGTGWVAGEYLGLA